MKIFHGRIIAADKGEATVTIRPDYGVDGIVIGEVVNIVPVIDGGEPPTKKNERQPGE